LSKSSLCLSLSGVCHHAPGDELHGNTCHTRRVRAVRLYQSLGWREAAGWRDKAWEADAEAGRAPGGPPRRLLYVRPVPGVTPPEVIARLG
jgi:hypothetical protein